MDIRNWSMDQILQLPDHFLSRRYAVFASLFVTPAVTAWDISELALPDRTVVHEFVIWTAGTIGRYVNARLALGDQLPTATAEMDRLEPLFSGLGSQGAEPRILTVGANLSHSLVRLKKYVPAQGRRLILEVTTATGVDIHVTAGIVVSAIPTEVPDCLLSV